MFIEGFLFALGLGAFGVFILGLMVLVGGVLTFYDYLEVRYYARKEKKYKKKKGKK